MIRLEKQSGFTVVELLISLFIASAFLVSGYQLFNVAIKDSGESRLQTLAGNAAYEYLQRYKSLAISPCNAALPGLPTNEDVPNLNNAKVTVTITCPYTAVTTISKVTSTVQFGTPSRTIKASTYVKP
jgi:prepilin-type N-terminal cleavage/methylation domain-containing protein